MTEQFCGCGHPREMHDNDGRGRFGQCQAKIGPPPTPAQLAITRGLDQREPCPCNHASALAQPRLCEESKDGHLVAVKMWPPALRYSGSRRSPSIDGVCEHCGAGVIVYDPIQPGLAVKLPSGQIIRGGVEAPISGGKKAS